MTTEPSADAGPPPAILAQAERFVPEWTVNLDGLILQRGCAGGPGLLLLADPGTGVRSSFLSANNVDYHTGTGPRLSIMHRGAAGWGWDAGYFLLDNYHSHADFTDLPNGTTLHVDAAGGPPVDSAHFSFGSQFRSGEFNVRRDVNDWLTFLGGFRWAELYETYAVQGETALILTPYTHLIETGNRLYGAQLGMQGTMWRLNNLRLDTTLKAGIFANAAGQRSLFDCPDPYGTFSAARQETHTAFLGELAVMLTYQLSDRLAIRGGYQFMWLEGVALTPQQIDVTNLIAVPPSAGLNTAAGLNFQGGIIGLELTW